MGFVIEAKDSMFLVTRDLEFIEPDRDVAAWQSKHVQKNPALRWILGKYVEADRANQNKQMWSLGDLQESHTTLDHAPLNVLHRSKYIVGTFVGTEVMYPLTDEADEQAPQYPYVEALAAFWRYYFPEELAVLEACHNAGTAHFSMECVAEQMHCAGEGGCDEYFPYKGPRHESYCDHINQGISNRHMVDPLFLGGALIFPPTKPGWRNAAITEISSAMEAEFAEYVHAALEENIPEGTSADWESMMAQIILQYEGSRAKKAKKTPKEIVKEVKRDMKSWPGRKH